MSCEVKNMEFRHLSFHGIFARSRNPVYLGLILIAAGVFLALGRLVLLVLAVGFWIYIRSVVGREERFLRERYGDAYRDYERRVFAWAAEQVKGEFREATWKAFWLTAVECRSGDEAAKELGMSLGAVHVANGITHKENGTTHAARENGAAPVPVPPVPPHAEGLVLPSPQHCLS